MTTLSPLLICLPLLVISTVAAAQAPASSIRETPNWHTQQPSSGTATSNPRWTMQASPPAAAASSVVPLPAPAPATGVASSTLSNPASRLGAGSVPPATSGSTNASLSTSGKVRIPRNLFKMNDGAIIIVGGRQMRAGELKLQVHAELKRLSTQSRAVRGPSRIIGGATPTASGLDSSKIMSTGLREQGLGNWKVKSPNLVADHAMFHPAVSSIAPRDTTNKVTEAQTYCLKHTVAVSAVHGIITPNGRFKIEGVCFGEDIGTVEVIGQFAGGKMNLVFDQWNDVEISAFMPAVTGVADGTIALTVVRADKTRSPAFQARFIATKEQVPVPARYWSPADSVDATAESDQSYHGPGAAFFGNASDRAASLLAARASSMSLSINPACALDYPIASPTVGSIGEIDGWTDQGPQNQANVTVKWTPSCIEKTQSHILETDDEVICQIQFSMQATASCPVGVAP